MTIVKLDGISFDVNPENRATEKTTNKQMSRVNDSGVIGITQPTELGETLKNLNDDSIEPDSRMSGIDMRTRLHPFEISSILALDALVSMRICPPSCLSFTRQKKRLNVSLMGKGRQEVVDIVAGKRDQEAKSGMSGFGDKVKGFMGMKQ